MQACRKRCGWRDRFLLFHWGSLCCTALTCHTMHGKDRCFCTIGTVQTCKKCFCTSTLYLHYLFISTAGWSAAAELVVCPPSVHVSVQPSLTVVWETMPCCSWGHCKVRGGGRQVMQTTKLPSGPEAARGSWNWSKDSPGGSRRELAPAGQKQWAAAQREQGDCYWVTTEDKKSLKARLVKRRQKKQRWHWVRRIY